MSTNIAVEDVDNVRWIRFARGEKRNALKLDDIIAVHAALREVPSDSRCIVFAGSNGDFSAGADVSGFSGSTMTKLEVAVESPGQQLVAAVRTCPVPTVAAIEGYCVGLAMVISAMCDIRVAARTAKFSMPEVKIGIPVIGDGGIFQQHIGLTRMKEMFLLGRYYSAETMDNWGFLNQLTETGEAEAAALVYAKELAGLPPRTVAAQKRIFEAWLQLPHRDAHRLSYLEYTVNAAHPDTAEWLTQFKAARAAEKKA